MKHSQKTREIIEQISIVSLPRSENKPVFQPSSDTIPIPPSTAIVESPLPRNQCKYSITPRKSTTAL